MVFTPALVAVADDDGTTIVVPPNVTVIRVPVVCATQNGPIAGAQFAVSFSSGLTLASTPFVPSQTLASLFPSITPVTQKDGKSYFGIYTGNNNLDMVNGSLLLGHIVFNYSGNGSETFEVKELEMIRKIDNNNTSKESYDEVYKRTVVRGEAGDPDDPNKPGDPDDPGGVTVPPLQIGDPDVPLAELNDDDDDIVYAPFITGYDDGTVKPNGTLTRAELAKMLYNLLGEEETDFTASFTDVQDTHWAYDAVAFCQERGFMLGYPDGSFAPGRELTRAELSTTIARVKNLAAGTSNPFTDVGDHWAKESIGAMFAAGHILGYDDGTFRPDKNVTRAETVTIICRAEGRDTELYDTDKTFTDLADPGFWAYDSMMNAANGYNYH